MKKEGKFIGMFQKEYCSCNLYHKNKMYMIGYGQNMGLGICIYIQCPNCNQIYWHWAEDRIGLLYGSGYLDREGCDQVCYLKRKRRIKRGVKG